MESEVYRFTKYRRTISSKTFVNSDPMYSILINAKGEIEYSYNFDEPLTKDELKVIKQAMKILDGRFKEEHVDNK